MSEALSLMAAELCFINVDLQLVHAMQELQHAFIKLSHRHELNISQQRFSAIQYVSDCVLRHRDTQNYWYIKDNC